MQDIIEIAAPRDAQSSQIAQYLKSFYRNKLKTWDVRIELTRVIPESPVDREIRRIYQFKVIYPLDAVDLISRRELEPVLEQADLILLGVS